jgi:hypothetical protein
MSQVLPEHDPAPEQRTWMATRSSEPSVKTGTGLSGGQRHVVDQARQLARTTEEASVGYYASIIFSALSLAFAICAGF